MSDITANEKAVTGTAFGTAQEGNTIFTDFVMEGLGIQSLPSLQDGAEGTNNARVMAYRDRIFEATGSSKEKA